MILFDFKHHICLKEYGILIPVNDSRLTNTLKAVGYLQSLKSYCEESYAQVPLYCTYKPVINEISESISREDILRVHDKNYIERLFAGGTALSKEIESCFELVNFDGSFNRYAPSLRELDFSDLLKKIIGICSGTYEACLRALQEGFCFFLGGGFHHAHFDHGSGFCVLNDIMIAARKLQKEKSIGRILIIDTDVHKGDGTAALCQNDSGIFTLSIHMKQGWPLDEENRASRGPLDPAFLSSDCDIELEVGESHKYNQLLEKELLKILASNTFEFAIVVAGSDPYEHDELPSSGLINLSLEEMLTRDHIVYDLLDSRKIPQTWLMAGGYGKRSWEVYANFLSSLV